MIIGVSGHIGSGKSEVVRIIQYITFKYQTYRGIIYLSAEDYLLRKKDKSLSSVFTEVKFADKLKDIVCVLLGCTREQLEDTTFKNTPLGEEWSIPCTSDTYTPRLLMQFIGTELFRNQISPDVWVNATMRGYNPISDVKNRDNLNLIYPKWVVSDMRFPNEMIPVRQHGFTIRVESDIVRGTDGTIKPREESTHESETALDNAIFDYYITNNSDNSLDMLIHDVHTILTSINGALY